MGGTWWRGAGHLPPCPICNSRKPQQALRRGNAWRPLDPCVDGQLMCDGKAWGMWEERVHEDRQVARALLDEGNRVEVHYNCLRRSNPTVAKLSQPPSSVAAQPSPCEADVAANLHVLAAARNPASPALHTRKNYKLAADLAAMTAARDKALAAQTEAAAAQQRLQEINLVLESQLHAARAEKQKLEGLASVIQQRWDVAPGEEMRFITQLHDAQNQQLRRKANGKAKRDAQTDALAAQAAHETQQRLQLEQERDQALQATICAQRRVRLQETALEAEAHRAIQRLYTREVAMDDDHTDATYTATHIYGDR